jgi:RsmE family RNA methyltransferase
VNIILFDSAEIGKNLPRRDERTTHLIKVLHKKAGDTFDAGIIEGGIGTGRIEAVRLDGSLSCSLDLREEPPEKAPIRIAVGFPRPIQLRRILRDLSSLGVASIDLIATELGEKSYRDTKLLTDGGARQALIEGCVQARDTRLPRLSSYNSLDVWLAERPWDKNAGTERPAPLLRPRLPPLLIAADNVRPEGALANLSAEGQAMVLTVGSERGWSDAERDKLEAAGFVRLSMGERALKTETACVAAAVLGLEKIGALG